MGTSIYVLKIVTALHAPKSISPVGRYLTFSSYLYKNITIKKTKKKKKNKYTYL